MGLNEFVGLLVTMYRCIGVVMTICMRVAWVLVYVGQEGEGSLVGVNVGSYKGGE